MEIPLEQLQVHEVPCYDAKCSAVFRGSLWHDDVAIKSLGSGKTSRATVSIFSDEPPCPNMLKDLKHEVSIMRRLTHKNIVRFKGVVINPPSIVTEYCEKGSLWDILLECHGAPEAFLGINDESVWMWRINIALQIAKGMYYLHWQLPIVLHNDLKSPNVFIDENWTVKIGDFGSATVGDEECTNPPDNNMWKSPEQMKGQKPTAKSDVFSFAVILWELYSFNRPWNNLCDTSGYPAKIAMFTRNQRIRDKVLNGERLKFPDNVVGGKGNGIQEAFKDLIEICWHPNPDDRPDFGQIIDFLTKLLGRLQKPKTGQQEEMRLMSMKDLLLKNHPAHASQAKSSLLDVKDHSWNNTSTNKTSVKRSRTKHSQGKWTFYNMMRLVQKVKPPFIGALKKTPSTTNTVTTNINAGIQGNSVATALAHGAISHCAINTESSTSNTADMTKTSNHCKVDSYSCSLGSDQGISSSRSISHSNGSFKAAGNLSTMKTTTVKSPFETAPWMKDAGYCMSWTELCNHQGIYSSVVSESLEKDNKSKTSTFETDGRSIVDDLDKRLSNCEINALALYSKDEQAVSHVEDFTNEEGNEQRLAEFEQSLHDCFAYDSLSFEGFDAYINEAKEYHEANADLIH